MTEIVTLDSFDRRLLDLVRRDNLEPARSLAAKVGLSESAVLRRLRRLRATGVITADIALVDPARITPTITMHVLVEMERESRAVMRGFEAALAARPEVVAAWNVTGTTDYVLIVAVPSVEAYDRFTCEMLSDEAHVRAFETMVSLREIVRYDPLRGPLAD